MEPLDRDDPDAVEHRVHRSRQGIEQEVALVETETETHAHRVAHGHSAGIEMNFPGLAVRGGLRLGLKPPDRPT
jgi:hypothetical protein